MNRIFEKKPKHILEITHSDGVTERFHFESASNTVINDDRLLKAVGEYARERDNEETRKRYYSLRNGDELIKYIDLATITAVRSILNYDV